MRAHLIRALGLGLVTAGLSELAFYPLAGDVRAAGLVLAYGLVALLISLLDAALPRAGWQAPVLLAALFGFLVEGAVVPALYEVPLLSIVWTPLAWHAALSLGVGVALWRAAAARGAWPAALCALGLGATLGVWGGYAWPALAPGPGPAPYAAQIAVAAAMMAAGHVLIGLAPRAPPVPWALGAMAALAALAWAVPWALPFFPLSLTLPLLTGLSLVALRRLPEGARAPRAVPPARHALVLLIPVAAIPVQAAMPPGTEMNAWWILLVGPPATAAWLAALGTGLAPARRAR